MSNSNLSACFSGNFVTFENTDLNIIDLNGSVWLTAGDLARALGYKSIKSISNLYNRNKDEFREDETALIDLNDTEDEAVTSSVTLGNLERKTRIYSARGCWTVAFLARTDRARAFRTWVKDVLENLNKKSPPGASKPLQNLSNKTIASLIADGTCGPALTEIPAIMAACAERLSGAMCLPHFKSAPAPSELAGFIADTTALRPDQLEAIAVAALRRVKAANGANGVQRMLREVNENFMLVNEAELMLCFYNSRRLKW